MKKVLEDNLKQALEFLHGFGFNDNLKDHDQEVIEDMLKRKLHPYHVIITKNAQGDVVFQDYLYLSEADDLTLDGWIEFLRNFMHNGFVYSNCISPFNYGEGELGLIKVVNTSNGMKRIG